MERIETDTVLSAYKIARAYSLKSPGEKMLIAFIDGYLNILRGEEMQEYIRRNKGKIMTVVKDGKISWEMM